MVTELQRIMPNALIIAHLEDVCFGRDAWSTRAVISEFCNTFCHVFAYTENEEIIGYVMVRDSVDDLAVSNLAVLPEHRRKGVGEALIRALIEFAESNNNTQVSLEVNTENLPAVKLYTKCGFEVAGVRKNFYRHSRYPTRDAYTLVYTIVKE